MKTIYFDENNCIMTQDSSDLTDEENSKLNYIMDSLELGHILLHSAEIDGNTWTVHYEDESTGDYVTDIY